MCPATNLALQVMQLIMANLVHGFEFDTPFNGPVDMQEGVGLANLKATPLEVLITPRISTSCFIN